MTNNQLRALMKRHKLSIEDLAKMLEASVSTVRSWLRPKTSKAQRNMTKKTEAILRERTGEEKKNSTGAKKNASSVGDASSPVDDLILP